MAEIKDLKENEFQSSKDIASVRTVKSDGNSGAVSLADLTTVLEERMGFPIADTKSTVIDFNTTINSGLYRVGSDSRNLPQEAYNYGILIVFKQTSFLAQIYIPDSNNEALYYRASQVLANLNSVNWKKLQGIVMS